MSYFKAEYVQIRFQPGSAPVPAGRAYDASPNPLNRLGRGIVLLLLHYLPPLRLWRLGLEVFVEISPSPAAFPVIRPVILQQVHSLAGSRGSGPPDFSRAVASC